ncbi:MAG: hypothetical protein ACOYOU_09845 [Kiritimatiellia bacterium]
MTNQNNRQPLRIALAAAAFLAVAAAVTTWLLPARRTPAAPSGVVPAAPGTAPVARPIPAAEAPVVVAKTLSLEEMKKEFAELMKKRAELNDNARASTRLISAGRITEPGKGANVNLASAVKFREALLAVEKALDNHPQVKALQALYDVAQADKVAVSRQQSEILVAWDKMATDPRDQVNDEIATLGEKFAAEQQEILKKAGVKDPRNLSSDAERQMQESHLQFTNRLRGVTARFAELTNTNALRLAREKDGSAKRMDDANARYQELEQQQAELQKNMLRVRAELRTRDPAIMALQAAAYAASQAHVAAVDSKPEAAKARAFLADVHRLRAAIDQRARALRKEIVASEPGYKDELDKQARSAGLAWANEDFWTREG